MSLSQRASAVRIRLTELLTPLLLLTRGIRRKRRWFSAASGVRGRVLVHYGLPELPSRNDVVTGHMLTVQDLNSTFVDSPRHFNLLYLVNGAIPANAQEMVWLAQRKGARLVLNQNGVAYPGWHGPGWAEANRPNLRLLRGADYVVYESKFCKLSADRYLEVRHHNWEILYNPVDTELFTPAQRTSGRSCLTLLLAGTQHQPYRLESALKCVAHLVELRSDVQLLVTGRLYWTFDQTEARRSALQMADRIGVADLVRFLGPYTKGQAPALFRQADILLHTQYNDACPRVVLEAMATGLPVVYSRSGGVPELVGDEAGIGIPAPLTWARIVPMDPKLASHAVLRVDERYAEFSEAARQRVVDRFDIRSWLQRHREIFEELTA